MADVRTELPGEEGAWKKLLNGTEKSPVPIIIKVDSASSNSKEKDKDSPSIPDTPTMGERKPSFLMTFNRQLRSSFRAVTDSPSAIQRYAIFYYICFNFRVVFRLVTSKLVRNLKCVIYIDAIF